MLSKANTNNSAVRARIFVLDDVTKRGDTGRVVLTTEPDLYAAMQQLPGRTPGYRQLQMMSPATAAELSSASCSATHNAIDNLETDKLDSILRALFDDREFNRKYNYSSLFLIGSGSYGCVFRVVSHATGKLENPLYDEQYVRFLQAIRRTKSRKRSTLLDSYRDNLCLDLVAMKVEALSMTDIGFQAANQIQLVKEFCILTELFRNSCSSNALVGFPMPIEFGFLGNQRVAKNLKKVLIFDMHGRPNNYDEALLGSSTILNLSPGDITNLSYMTMELLGPNLDEWKAFFAASHGHNKKVVFSVQTTLKLMDQFLCRLIVMHRKNLVHLDLKPDNLCMGIGKMSNTVYLLDYGLSRFCSDEKPTITMGSRRYMSVGVLNLWPANFMMDIESWFYVLIVLLTDYVPWSDEILVKEHGMSQQTACDELIIQTAQLKKQFWGDDNLPDKKLFQRVIEKAESYHKTVVPDIGAILTDIYAHIKRMRQDFYPISSARMHADIRNEESDLFKRYHTLRKLLLFAYDCDFTERGGCFYKDKDLFRKQEKRRSRYPQLIFAENGRNWHWDWDEWFEEEFVSQKDDSAAPADRGRVSQQLQAASNKANANVNMHARRTSDPTEEPDESDDDDDEDERMAAPASSSASIPEWMKHYLARVLGNLSTEDAAGSAEDSDRAARLQTEPSSVLVA